MAKVHNMAGYSPPLAVLVAAGLCAFTGCRDLDFPGGSGPINAGPVVRFLSPAAAAVVPRTVLVRVSAEDVNGVGQVSLRCGGALLASWGAAPFEGQVNLSSCVSAGPADGGSSKVALTLVAQATDALGNAGEAVTLAVVVDLSTVAVHVALPDRVLPGSTLQFSITTDGPIRGLPEVTVEGAAATVQEGPGGFIGFTGTLTPTPGLGTDLYPVPVGSTAEVPMSVLEQLERPLLVTVTAVAANGNPTRLDQTVLLSRIVFSRAVPGGISSPTPMRDAGASPGFDGGMWVRAVGTAAGLSLHVPSDSAGNAWVPGWMEAGSGALDVVTASLLTSRTGLTAQAFDGKGRALMHTDDYASGPEDYLVDFGGRASRAVAGMSVPADAGVPTLLQLAGDALCLEAAPVWPSSTICPMTYQLTCLEADGGVTALSVPSGAGSFQVSELMLRSGPVQLNFPPATVPYNSWACVSGVGQPQFLAIPRGALIGRPGSMVFTELLDAGTLERALPVGDGTFVLTQGGRSAVGGLLPTTTALFSEKGVRGASFFRPLEVSAADVVTAAADGSVIALRRPAPYTQTLVERWLPGANSAADSYPLPGYWEFVPGVVPALPTNAIVDRASGKVAMLLKVGGAAQGQFRVAVFDARLRPKWIYSYPAAIAEGAARPALISDEPGSALYLVDYANQAVTALAW